MLARTLVDIDTGKELKVGDTVTALCGTSHVLTEIDPEWLGLAIGGVQLDHFKVFLAAKAINAKLIRGEGKAG